MRNLLIFFVLIGDATAWSPPKPVAPWNSPWRSLHSSSKLALGAADVETNEPNNETGGFMMGEVQSTWFLPPALSTAAFFSYTETSVLFHDFIDTASGHQWTAADGGKYMAEIVKPVLNGPVTLSISILFGTLIAMTIQTLYNRQTSIHKKLISIVEEVRELQLLAEGFPEPYRSQGTQLLNAFTTESFQDFSSGQVTAQSLRKKEMGSFLLMLNKLSQESNCPNIIVGEAYGSVSRMKDIRSEFIATLQTVFSAAHYANIVALASTILFVFLLETDQNAMQFLLGFELSICWALLIGTYALLGVVIYDLSTPFSGIFRSLQMTAEDMESVKAYAMAVDEKE
jgi:hypothetical protein